MNQALTFMMTGYNALSIELHCVIMPTREQAIVSS